MSVVYKLLLVFAALEVLCGALPLNTSVSDGLDVESNDGKFLCYLVFRVKSRYIVS